MYQSLVDGWLLSSLNFAKSGLRSLHHGRLRCRLVLFLGHYRNPGQYIFFALSYILRTTVSARVLKRCHVRTQEVFTRWLKQLCAFNAISCPATVTWNSYNFKLLFSKGKAFYLKDGYNSLISEFQNTGMMYLHQWRTKNDDLLLFKVSLIVNCSYKGGQFYRKWIEQVGKPVFCFLKISLEINCSSFNSSLNSLIIALLAYFFVWLKALHYNFGFVGTFTWERLHLQFIMVAMIISRTVFFFQTF